MNLNSMGFIQEITYLNKEWDLCNTFDEPKLIGTHWIAFYVNGNNIIYFESFKVIHIPKKKKKIRREQIYNNRSL